MHAIEIESEPAPPGDEHHRRNFVEAVWVSAWKSGWVKDLEFLQRRSTEMWSFGFLFSPHASHRAVTMVEDAIKDHFMQDLATFRHIKKAKRG